MQSQRSTQSRLDKIFKPRNVAIIGASVKKDSVGYAVMKNMLDAGFKGNIFPVNLKYNTILDRHCYHYIGKISEKIDLAVITTPARTVPGLVEECGKAGVGGLLIISAGFKEAGEEGQKMYEQILQTARHYNMRIIGPNCLGILNPNLGMNASFATRSALKGNIAFISQSGALGTSILDWAVDQNVGFSYFVSVGSMIDVSFADLIDYFGTDNNTSSILIYMESLKDARRFMSAARAFARSKPIIILKAGKSQEGGRAAMSHTGSLAGDDAIYDTAFRRAGIIRVDTIAQLFNCAQALAMQPRPRNNRLAILTNAGGPGVLATDYLIGNGGRMAPLSEETMAKLNEILPPHWSHNNPVDVLGDATADIYRQALEACVHDVNVDGVLAIFTTQAVSEPAKAAIEVVQVARDRRKPILAVWMGEQDVADAREILEHGRVPHYRYPESAVDVFIRMCQYSQNLKLLYETPSETPHEFVPDTAGAQKIIYRALETGERELAEHVSKVIMACYDIPVTVCKIAKKATDAVKYANELGYPVVLKIESPDISHKSDAGGVKLNLRNEENVREAFDDIIDSVKKYQPDAHIEGILVERMIDKPFELFIGAKKDQIFGPVIAFGQGGIGVEVFKDTRLGLPPLNMALARQIIRNTRIYPLLKGYRGQPGVNLEELAFTLCKFSYLLMDFPEIAEIDINPFMADDAGGIVVDAHIALDKAVGKRKKQDYQHLVISPYPAKYIREVKLRDDTPATLRPIRPEDEPLVEKMFQYLSKESLYYRFFGYVPQVTHEFLARYTQNDYDREIAIIVEIEDKGEKLMIGVVRIIADAWGENAEYAILIADPWQRQGLGTILTDYILEIARDKGIRKIYASVLATNKGMIRLFEKHGFTIKRDGFDTFYVELDLEKMTTK